MFDLGKTLKALTKANSKAFLLQTAIDEYCLSEYGCTPSEIDNDTYIDSCLGGTGVSKGMTAHEFHNSMVSAIELLPDEVQRDIFFLMKDK